MAQRVLTACWVRPTHKQKRTALTVSQSKHLHVALVAVADSDFVPRLQRLAGIHDLPRSTHAKQAGRARVARGSIREMQLHVRASCPHAHAPRARPTEASVHASKGARRPCGTWRAGASGQARRSPPPLLHNTSPRHASRHRGSPQSRPCVWWEDCRQECARRCRRPPCASCRRGSPAMRAQTTQLASYLWLPSCLQRTCAVARNAGIDITYTTYTPPSRLWWRICSVCYINASPTGLWQTSTMSAT